jgi:hypothetical protein
MAKKNLSELKKELDAAKKAYDLACSANKPNLDEEIRKHLLEDYKEYMRLCVFDQEFEVTIKVKIGCDFRYNSGEFDGYVFSDANQPKGYNITDFFATDKISELNLDWDNSDMCIFGSPKHLTALGKIAPEIKAQANELKKLITKMNKRANSLMNKFDIDERDIMHALEN